MKLEIERIRNLKFCVKLKKSRKDFSDLVKLTFKNKSMSWWKGFECNKRIKYGWT